MNDREFEWNWCLRVGVGVTILAVVVLGVTGIAGWVFVLDRLSAWQGQHFPVGVLFSMCWVVVVGVMVFRRRARARKQGVTPAEVLTTLVDEANNRGPLEGWELPTTESVVNSRLTFPITWPDSKAKWVWHDEPAGEVTQLGAGRVFGVTVEGADLFLVEAFPATTDVPWLRLEFTELIDTDPAVCVVHSGGGEVTVRVFEPSPGHRVLTHEQFEVGRRHDFDPTRLGFTSEGRSVLAAAFTKPE